MNKPLKKKRYKERTEKKPATYPTGLNKALTKKYEELKGRSPRKKAPAKEPYPTPTNEMDWDQLGKLQSLGVDVSDDIIRDTNRFKGLDTVELDDPQQALRRHQDTRKKPFLEQLADKLRDVGDTEREWREQETPEGEPSELPDKSQKGKDFINKIINLLK